MFKRPKEPEKNGSEKREDLLVSFLKVVRFVFAIIYVKIVTLDFVQHHKMVLIPVHNTGQSVGAQIFQSYPARDSLESE